MCFIETPVDVLPCGVSGKHKSGMLDVFHRHQIMFRPLVFQGNTNLKCSMCFIETPDDVLFFGVSGKHQSGMLHVFHRNTR